PWASKRRVQLSANERLDELANPLAQAALDRIKPVVEKVGGGVGCRLERIRLHGNVCHGVVSVPALQRRMIRGSIRRLRQPNSNHFRYATWVRMRDVCGQSILELLRRPRWRCKVQQSVGRVGFTDTSGCQFPIDAT